MKSNWFAIGLIAMFLVFATIFAFQGWKDLAGWLIFAVFWVLLFWGWETAK